MALFVTNVYNAKEMKSKTIGDQIRSLSFFAFNSENVVNVKRLVITAGANAIRISWSGDDPSATVGHYIAANGNYTLDGSANCQRLKLVNVTGGSLTTITLEV